MTELIKEREDLEALQDQAMMNIRAELFNARLAGIDAFEVLGTIMLTDILDDVESLVSLQSEHHVLVAHDLRVQRQQISLSTNR